MDSYKDPYIIPIDIPMMISMFTPQAPLRILLMSTVEVGRLLGGSFEEFLQKKL